MYPYRMMSPHFGKIITEEADLAGVDARLACAIAEVESAGDPLAVRFETHWKYYFDVPQFAFRCRVSQDTERTLQSCSWGLMQVMGSVARELGFLESLIKLSDPRIGAKYGCMKLAQCLKKWPKKLDDAIAAYNAGSPRVFEGRYVNQAYVDKVRQLYGKDQKDGITRS